MILLNQTFYNIFKASKHFVELEDRYMEKVAWRESNIRELDISSSDLSSGCLIRMLSQMKQLTYLSVSHNEFFSDEVTQIKKHNHILQSHLTNI